MCNTVLGIILSSNLSWSNHYNHISRSAYHSLHLIRHSFSSTLPVYLKKNLHLSLVHSRLTYCSQIWRLRLLKDILSIERIQWWVIKYILSDSHFDYKSRLVSLHLLPLMYWFDLQDVLFFVQCLKDKSDKMNIYEYITFVSSSIRSSTSNKLVHNFSWISTARHFYFNRVILLWSALPSINLALSIYLPFVECLHLMLVRTKWHFGRQLQCMVWVITHQLWLTYSSNPEKAPLR